MNGISYGVRVIMFTTNYLDDAQLKGFDYYEYRAEDTNPLSKYLMNPFWNQVVKICPKSVAPNVLTFTGFSLTVFNFFLLVFYDYQLYASADDHPEWPAIPNWVWLVCAINLFTAHTLDGIDGKQARKIGCTGPLGEMFDHGLDSWTTALLPPGIYSVFGRGRYSVSLPRLYVCVWVVLLNFFVSHWEKYITDVLFLPWGYDVAFVVMEIIYLATYIGGHSMWAFNLPGTTLCSETLFEASLWAGLLLCAIPMAVSNVHKSYRDGTGKMLSLPEACRPVIPIVLLFLMTTPWALWSPNDVMDKDPRCFFFFISTIFSNINCRLIVDQMSGSRCSLSNWLLYPTAFCCAAALTLQLNSFTELWMLRCLTLVVTAAQIHYGVCVVRQMCDHMKIKCFSIKRKSP